MVVDLLNEEAELVLHLILELESQNSTNLKPIQWEFSCVAARKLANIASTKPVCRGVRLAQYQDCGFLYLWGAHDQYPSLFTHGFNSSQNVRH